MTFGQKFAQFLGTKVIPSVEWTGFAAHCSEIESSGVETGLVSGGLLDGLTIRRETEKYNCGAYSEWVTVEGCTGHFANAMNGCWQYGHQRDEENTFAPNVAAALAELHVCEPDKRHWNSDHQACDHEHR